jgi:hypothetical protein
MDPLKIFPLAQAYSSARLLCHISYSYDESPSATYHIPTTSKNGLHIFTCVDRGHCRECMNINCHGITTINGGINHSVPLGGVKNIRRGKQSDKHRDDLRLESAPLVIPNSYCGEQWAIALRDTKRASWK